MHNRIVSVLTLTAGLVVPAGAVEMPSGGIVAHRGASATHPENTLAAFREAIWRGAQQIEFDVDMTADGELVIMHDSTVDRTTNGSGSVGSFTLAQLKLLDAGSWKNSKFTGERVPTLAEALSIMPENVWLNVHMKGDYTATYNTVMEIFAQGREHQAFLAVTAQQAQAARAAAAAAGKSIMLCNMENQSIASSYVTETIAGGFDFLQFRGTSGALPSAFDLQRLHDAGIKANYYGASALSGTLTATKRQTLRSISSAGIDFPLVDDVVIGTSVAEEFLYEPLRPAFRGNVHPASLGSNVIVNPGAEIWMDDYHTPTTAPVPTTGSLLIRDRELFGWNDVVEVTNEPYDAANMPSSDAFPSETFGVNAFVGGRIIGTRWIQQTIDLAGLEDVVDAGNVEYVLSGWLGGLAGQKDYTALTATFLDEDGQTLDSAEIQTLVPEDWGNVTSMVYLDEDGSMPIGCRSIDVRLWFNGQSGPLANGMADNLSLVLTESLSEQSVPEPATWSLVVFGGLSLAAVVLFARQRKTFCPQSCYSQTNGARINLPARAAQDRGDQGRSVRV